MTIETITREGWSAEIWHDHDCESPLDCEDVFKITYRASSRYILGNEPVNDPQEWLADCVAPHLPNGYDTIERLYDTLGDERADAALWRHFERHYIALPVFAYIHSGIALNCGGFHCPWDSGQSGMIYASRAAVREAWQIKRIDTKRIQSAMRSIVQEYGRYLNGECYGFTITDPDGDAQDACGGFIGSEYAEQEARDMLDWHIQDAADTADRQRRDYAETAARAMESASL